jgi:uncharacterized damage-inducible protein DinB
MIKDSILPEFDHEVATTRKLLERLPDEQLSWKPHDKSMSLGGLATHLANIPNWTTTILDQVAFDLADLPPNLTPLESRAKILAFFDDSCRKSRSLFDKTDAEYLARWTLKQAGREMFTLPRLAALRSYVLNHLVHHRGQLSVYLRLNDIPVPAIYGPSADEG